MRIIFMNSMQICHCKKLSWAIWWLFGACLTIFILLNERRVFSYFFLRDIYPISDFFNLPCAKFGQDQLNHAIVCLWQRSGIPGCKCFARSINIIFYCVIWIILFMYNWKVFIFKRVHITFAIVVESRSGWLVYVRRLPIADSQLSCWGRSATRTAPT